MKVLCLILMTFWSISIRAAQVVKFNQADDRLKVYQGQMVDIQADSALVISTQRVALLNQKLQELQAMRVANYELMQANQEMLAKVRKIEHLTAQLLVKIEKDRHAMLLDMNELIAELDRSILVLKTNNAHLEANNEALAQQLAEMELTIKHLKKQIRKIWWKSTADKILIALTAFATGLIVGGVAL